MWLDADEVDEVFDVPLPYILNRATLRREPFVWQGQERDIFKRSSAARPPHLGATAAILKKNLLDRLSLRAMTRSELWHPCLNSERVLSTRGDVLVGRCAFRLVRSGQGRTRPRHRPHSRRRTQ